MFLRHSIISGRGSVGVKAPATEGASRVVIDGESGPIVYRFRSNAKFLLYVLFCLPPTRLVLSPRVVIVALPLSLMEWVLLTEIVDCLPLLITAMDDKATRNPFVIPMTYPPQWVRTIGLGGDIPLME